VCTAMSSTRIASSRAPVRSPARWQAVRAMAPGSLKAASSSAAVADELNGRPRKTLGWKTPAEVLDSQPG